MSVKVHSKALPKTPRSQVAAKKTASSAKTPAPKPADAKAPEVAKEDSFEPARPVLDSNVLEGTLTKLADALKPLVDGVSRLVESISPEANAPWSRSLADFAAANLKLRSLASILSDPNSAPDALERAGADLASSFGYTPQSMPKPGALWIDPHFLGTGKVDASKWPVKAPVARTPKPLEALFGQGRKLEMFKADGSTTSVANAADYAALVSSNRAAGGMPRTDGQPVGVQLSLQGGGGMGKRLGAALSEMYSQGVVPVSITGASVGAITASLLAAGADPVELKRFGDDPIIDKFMDVGLLKRQDGVMSGEVAFDAVDQELRKLTGITDRPVTFADLKLPLQLVATKVSDSGPGASGPGTFVFSQETTPNTSVALAVRASMSLPGVFDPVRMVDPTTGREVQLMDGGILDNLPIGYNPDKSLPTVALALVGPGQGHPQDAENLPTNVPLPTGSLPTGNFVENLVNGLRLTEQSNRRFEDYRQRTQPAPGSFVFSIPVFNLDDPTKKDSLLEFKTNPQVDPAIDLQTHQLTRDFFRGCLGKLNDPTASAANCTSKVPADIKFDLDVRTHGKVFRAAYSGGDSVVLTSGSERHELKLGRPAIEAMYLDQMAFGSLAGALTSECNKRLFL